LADTPELRLAALAARVLMFTDATISRYDGTERRVLASTSVGLSGGHDVVAILDDAVRRSRAPVAVEDLAHVSDNAGLPVLDSAEGAYLGVPLVNSDEDLIGVLSVTNRTRRSIGVKQIGLLLDFGRVVSDQLDLMRTAQEPEDRCDGRAAEVARAVAHGQIVPWYQPIVDLNFGRFSGVEVLARWEHPTGELKRPAAFISLAERTNVIVDLDMAVMHRGLVDLKRWQLVNPALRMSFNLSGRHLDQTDSVGVVRRAVEEAGISPFTVDLELTETVRPADSQASSAKIQEFRGLGFKIWFDDFGSGWSSLQDLIQLPVDGIKLDRAFAADLGTHVDDAVIRALTRVSAELSLKVTIEGIETKEQAVLARSLGCDYAQGFLWSGAVPAASVEQLLPGSSAGRPLERRARDKTPS
jgi:EAL domain-containing protein (putative c-di-GMP-specific phosphodiesterase class I)